MLSRLIFSVREGGNYYVQATAQQNARRALPEEIIRQLVVLSLLHHYKYPENRIRLEYKVQIGRERKRADIVILDENDGVLVIIEIKVETDQHSMAQLKSYMTITGAQYGALISASQMECIQMRSARDVSFVRDIPLFDVSSSSLPDILLNTTTEDSVLPNGGRIQPEDTANASQAFPLKQLIGIEQFERTNNTLVNITIKGITLHLPIEDICSYKTLRKRFIQKGIALIPGVKEAEWYLLFSYLLESNPMPEQSKAPTTSVSILVEYLNAHIGERLVVTQLNTGMTVQNDRPANGLSQRYEKDTHTLWVSTKHIKQYLESHTFDYKGVKDDLAARGILISSDSKKVLGARTDYAGGQILCWKIRADHPEVATIFSGPV